MGEWKWMRRTGAVILAVMFFCMTGVTASFAEEDGQEELVLYSQSAVLMDGRTGRVLWEKDGETARPMASTTKIMTCILALELGLDDERITEVSSNAASQPEVHLGMKAGQRFYTKDLLYSLMLESHNDTAVAIAEEAAGSVEAFADLMNRKAGELGCTDTWFITPNGLDRKENLEDGTEKIHSASAKDLARILRYCVLESPRADAFLEITRTSDYSFRDAEGRSNYSCRNHNALLSMMEGVLSGKTGFTSGAGYCYTAAVEDGGRVFIIALLGCGWPPHKTYKWSDASKLIAYGKENYQYRDLYCPVELEDMPVKNGAGAYEETLRTAVRLQAGDLEPVGDMALESDLADAVFPVLVSSGDQVRVVKRLPDFLEAPVEMGDRAGVIEYYLNGELAAQVPVYAAESMEAFTFSWCLDRLAEKFLVNN